MSVVLWHVALRHVPEEGCTAGEIASAGLLSLDPLKVVLGCLERWGHVGLDGDASRAGWGSGRGITRTKALVAQTAAFTADPGSLPHFPVWDGNRGFGP